ncbi:MAG: peptide-methionine (S)-S-oxide reductase, partial [Comamonadaceae bacterium]|nr:peptide-methionine (S)-S-oxide reductase [Comamonadaceae bacterium]
AEQLETVRAFVQALNSQNVFGMPVVTQVEPLDNYWPAENYHQDYFARNPHQGYCAYVVGPKVKKFMETFSAYAKKDEG